MTIQDTGPMLNIFQYVSRFSSQADIAQFGGGVLGYVWQAHYQARRKHFNVGGGGGRNLNHHNLYNY